MLDVFGANSRPVYWIGSPPLSDPDKDAGVRQLNEVAKSIVALNHDATYVDAYKLFGDKNGKYTPTLPGPKGNPILVRTSDGVHFTPAGADLLAAEVDTHLDRRCRIIDQAAPGRRQPVRETPGSSQLTPSGNQTTGNPTTRSRSAPATTTTAPPPTTTEPPTTALPISLPVVGSLQP